MHTLPNPLQNPVSEKTDDPHERRILQMMHNDLVETAALAILNNWVLFLRKAALPTSPPLNSNPDSSTVLAPDSSVVDQPPQLKRVGRVCIEAAGQLLRTLRKQVALFKEDPAFSIYMYSPTTVRRCFAAGVVLSRVAAICDEADVKACREGLALAEELMGEMEAWLIAHAGRDAEGSTGGDKGGSPLVILSLLRATVDFQTGNHHAKLRPGMKRSHADMLEEAPQGINLKSLETLPVPFTDGKFFFCKLDGPMRALAQTRQSPAPPPVPVPDLPTEGDSNPSGSSRPSTGERIKKVKFTRRAPKLKVQLKVETSASASPLTPTPDRMTPQRRKEPPRLQPYPSSHTPTAVVTPSPAANVRFSSSSLTPLQSTTTDAPPEQASGPTSKPIPRPSIQTVGARPPSTQVHDANDVAQFDPSPVVSVPPMIRRPAPRAVQSQQLTWHTPAPYEPPSVPIQYPPPTPQQIASFGYMHASDVPQYDAVQTIPYSSYSAPPPPSQPQSIPMHPMHQDTAVSWSVPGSLPQPPPSAFAQQAGHSNAVGSYSQGSLPPATPSTYQHLPGAYPQMAGPSLNQSIPGIDQQQQQQQQQLYNVHPMNDSYYLPGYSYRYP